MEIKAKFGEVEVDGKKYERDIIIFGKEVKLRRKDLSAPKKPSYGHTPLTREELEPFETDLKKFKKMIIGKGFSGFLPTEEEALNYLKSLGLEVVSLNTPDAIEEFRKEEDAILFLHITC